MRPFARTQEVMVQLFSS